MDMDLKSFIGGCLGGFAGIVSSYPFDTLKVRIQNQHRHELKYSGSMDCLSLILRKESASALYKGMSSPLVGSMFINAVLFGVEENVRKMLHLNDPKYRTSDKTREFYELYAVSGAIAGLTQSFLLSPVELVKIRMQIPGCHYQSTWCCVKDILKNHNLRHLFRGTWLTVLRDVPAVSSYFVSFEYICNSYRISRDNLPVLHLLMAGGIAGCFSWLITYPIDVIKTRFQADESYSSVKECLKKALSTEGNKVLFRGLAPTLLRAFPNNAAVFATVNLFNRLMNNLDPDDNYESNTTTIPSYPNLHFFIDTYDMHR
ncbi:mitochondrial basic amino acids transporter-like [Brachionus plicatilis]|nr:mitochondrial basic amino acids transporter-like [Brachionus plicatilis]